MTDKHRLTGKFLRKLAAVASASPHRCPVVVGRAALEYPIRIDRAQDCVRAMANEEFMFPQDDEFAGVFVRWWLGMPSRDRLIFALRYGLFSGVCFSVSELWALVGLAPGVVVAVERKTAETFDASWAQAVDRHDKLNKPGLDEVPANTL